MAMGRWCCIIGLIGVWLATSSGSGFGATAHSSGQESSDTPPAVSTPVPVLQWKFEAGQRFLFDIERSTQTERDVAGNKVLESGIQRCNIRWEIDTVDSSGVTVQMRYTEIEVDLGTPAGKVAVSTNPSAPAIGSGRVGELAKLLRQRITPLIDQPLTLKFDQDGKLLAVELGEELMAHVQSGAETRSLRDLVGREGIQQILSTFLTPLPKQASTHWEQRNTYEVAAGVPLSQTTKYEWIKTDNASDIAEIKFTSELGFPEQFLLGPVRPGDPQASAAKDPNPPRSTLRDPPPPFDFDPVSNKWPRIALQDASGVIQFDVAGGYVRSATARSTLVTEKAYSDALIKITMTTQSKLSVQRL